MSTEQHQNFNKLCSNLERSTKNIQNNVSLSLKYACDLINISNIPNSCDQPCHQIINRLKEIQTHLEQISLECYRIKNIEANQRNTEAHFRDKRFLKHSRSSSMKYLAQWEKIVEVQLSENNQTKEEEPMLLPKPMIQKRLKQFGHGEKKRTSSTVEGFLDAGSTNSRAFDSICIKEEDEAEEEVQNEAVQTTYREDGEWKKYDEEKTVQNTKPTIVDMTYKLKDWDKPVEDDYDKTDSEPQILQSTKPRIVDIIYKIQVPSEESV